MDRRITSIENIAVDSTLVDYCAENGPRRHLFQALRDREAPETRSNVGPPVRSYGRIESSE